MSVRIGPRDQSNKRLHRTNTKAGKKGVKRTAHFLSNEDLENAISNARPREWGKLIAVYQGRLKRVTEVVYSPALTEEGIEKAISINVGTHTNGVIRAGNTVARWGEA